MCYYIIGFTRDFRLLDLQELLSDRVIRMLRDIKMLRIDLRSLLIVVEVDRLALQALLPRVRAVRIWD